MGFIYIFRKEKFSMSQNNLPEYWLRGKVEGIHDFLQPAAHAFLQSKMEARKYLIDFPPNLLWEKPAGRASVGFHLKHITGVTDRLLTYAKLQNLSEDQLKYLKEEGIPDEQLSVKFLLENLDNKVEEVLEFLKTIPAEELKEERFVGRKKIPSTLIGILFHAAEHSQRHIGQMLVTISVLKKGV